MFSVRCVPEIDPRRAYETRFQDICHWTLHSCCFRWNRCRVVLYLAVRLSNCEKQLCKTKSKSSSIDSSLHQEGYPRWSSWYNPALRLLFWVVLLSRIVSFSRRSWLGNFRQWIQKQRSRSLFKFQVRALWKASTLQCYFAETSPTSGLKKTFWNVVQWKKNTAKRSTIMLHSYHTGAYHRRKILRVPCQNRQPELFQTLFLEWHLWLNCEL